MVTLSDADGTSALPHFHINPHDQLVTTKDENKLWCGPLVCTCGQDARAPAFTDKSQQNAGAAFLKIFSSITNESGNFFLSDKVRPENSCTYRFSRMQS
ncbi:MAG: hypothetical protein C4527_20215 [Candidatus Omnitrophota bacterium]|nr:MAG: hypothetical protein C4527_20215 [Candidatus Omnitrophota bacterium]